MNAIISTIGTDALSLRERISRRAARRRWPILLTGVTVVSGLLFSLMWAPTVHHIVGWKQSGDLWVSFRAAHFVAWGDFGDVYYAPYTIENLPGLVTLPGLWIVLAPLAALSSSLGLTESFPGIAIHPTAWPGLLGVSLLLSGLAIFGFDALGERLGLSRSRRIVGCCLVAVPLWELTAMWGHPEYAIALGFAAYGTVAALDGQWKRVGWLFGASICFQPLTVFPLAVILTIAGRQGIARALPRALGPPIALVAIPLIKDWSHASVSLFGQTTFPGSGWKTPWLRWADVTSVLVHRAVPPQILQTTLTSAGCQPGSPVAVTQNCIKLRNFLRTADNPHNVYVTTVHAATVRALGVVVIAALVFWAYRRRSSAWELAWFCGVVLLVRCSFEVVMFPYYVVPGVAWLAVVALGQRSRRRAALGCLALGCVFVYANWHGPPGRWYGILAALIVVASALSFPSDPGAGLVRVGRPAKAPDADAGSLPAGVAVFTAQ